MGYYKTNRDFHEARWDEPIIMKLGNPGERGVLVPKADEKVTKATSGEGVCLVLEWWFAQAVYHRFL